MDNRLYYAASVHDEREIDAVVDLLPRLVHDVRARGRSGAAA